MTDWHPMSQAPKDRPLLAKIKTTSGEEEYAVIYWEKIGYISHPTWCYGSDDLGNDHQFRAYCEPLYWRYLPDD